MNQARAPLFEALKAYIDAGITPFHVPGHKQGKGLKELRCYLGRRALAMDLTCLPALDNICHPTGVIKEAEELAAAAYGADHAFFLVNGTTSGIQAMISATCQTGDKIILPRNAHKSAIGGLVISGAVPVYLDPAINDEFGISMGIRPESLQRAIEENPDAKAVFVINPTYYGAASDLRAMVTVAHQHGLPVIVDEAHGAHLPFSSDLPLSAMAAGADLAAVSMHKLAGSLTQSSMLLLREGLLEASRVKAVLNLSQTTSPSYLLLASLDLARKQMATRGESMVAKTLALAAYLRQELRCLPGIRVMEYQDVAGPGCSQLDPTKVTVNVLGLGLSGYQAEEILRRDYHIQVELSDLYNVLVLLSIGDTRRDVTRLLNALRDLSQANPLGKVVKYCPPLPALPSVCLSPREAFYRPNRRVTIEEAAGEVSAETITAYPPGIPLICAGEVITQDIIDYLYVLREEHAELQGQEDPHLTYLKVVQAAGEELAREAAVEAG